MLALLCVAQFVVVLDVTIVAVVLPSVGADLGMAPGALQWVIAGYGLAFGGFLMLGGRAGDLYGRRRLFAAGLALFSGASLACGLATTGSVLVAARALQGLGAAALAPAALAILAASVAPGAMRDRAVAVWTAAAAGGGALRWVLGGVLTQALGWRAVFLVNVPVGAAALMLVPRLLPESRDPAARGLDVPGAVALTLALTALVHALTRVPHPDALVSLGVAASALSAFAWLTRRVASPLVPRGSLRVPGLRSASLVSAVVTATTTPPVFLCTLYVAHVLDRAPAATGLAFAPFNVSVIGGSWVGARGLRRVGSERAMAAGLAAIGAGAVALLGLTAHGRPSDLLVPMLAMGFGTGLAATASTARGTASADAGRHGLASGLLNAAAQVGTSVGLALLVTLAGDGGLPGYRRAFAAAAVIAGAAAAALLLRRAKRSDRAAVLAAPPSGRRGPDHRR